jgi:serine/threonine protein kinase
MAAMSAGEDKKAQAPTPSLAARRSLQQNGRPRLTIDASRQVLQPSTRHIRHLDPEVKIFDLYSWDTVLQEDGDGGKVVVCRPKNCQNHTSAEVQEYVLKIRSKASLQEAGMEDQFRRAQERMLNFPAHEGVVPLYEVLESDDFYYVVMAKASGGPLFCSLVSEFRDGVMPASAMRRLMVQILQAVSHIHQQGMLHRDIKPDNLVMQVYPDPQSPTGKASRVALIDFDHADPDWSPVLPQTLHDGETVFGTLRFNAPETFQGSFSQESDLYSVGVILYLLMSGQMPYDDDLIYEPLEKHERKQERSPRSPTHSPHSPHNRRRRCSWKDNVYNRMQETPVDWSCPAWKEQPLCFDFCKRLLAFEPRDRFPDAEQALAHAWFQEDT